MKKNSNGILFLISVLILCGFGYYIYNDYKSLDRNFNKIETSVSVTDEGISYGIENVYDSVVVVQNYKNNKENGIGSGFIYSEDGYIMTNHHVIDGATNVKVLLMSGESVDCEVIGSDEYADIAVIKIPKENVSKVAKLGDSETVKLGDTVFTIGSPLGIEYFGTVTRGILSAKNRMVEVSVSSSSNDWIMNVMQTDAAINPGNSGGPLININGEVIGINSLKLVKEEVEGIGFSIPIDDAMIFVKKLEKGEEIVRPMIGVSLIDQTETYALYQYRIMVDDSAPSGVVIADVSKDSPASKSGLKTGDIVTKINDNKISSRAEFRYQLYKYSVGDEIQLTYFRDGKEKTVSVKLDTPLN